MMAVGRMTPLASAPTSATGSSGEQSHQAGLSSSGQANTNDRDITQVPCATAPISSPHHGKFGSSFSEYNSTAFPQSPAATAAITPERDIGGPPPFLTLPVQNCDLLPLRIQDSCAPSALETYQRQRRHLEHTTDRWGCEFVWPTGSEPTEETARELLEFYTENEDLVRRTHGLGLPFNQTVRDDLADGRAKLSLGSVTRFACGARNVLLFEVSFVVHGWRPYHRNLPVVMVLLCIYHPEDPFYRVESDVATSTFKRDVAGIPTSHIYSFDSSGANPLGLKWALVGKMTGRLLNEFYGPLLTYVPLREKEAIMDDLVFGQLSRHCARLFDHAFTVLGSLYLDHNAAGAWYHLGPVVSPFFCLGRRLLCEVANRGPYTHLRHYVSAQLRLLRWELPPLSLPLRLSSEAQGGDASTRAWRRICEKMQVVTGWTEATLEHTEAPLRTFPVHPDLHPGNLLMDAKYQLTGILDLENLACLPLALYAPPSVATADGDLGNCGPARFETLTQLPPPDQIPRAILCACSTSAATMKASTASDEEEEGEGEEEKELRGVKEDVIPRPEIQAQYLARCTARLRSAGADFFTFPWWVPEYFSAPPSRAVIAANASAHAGEEGRWAALQKNVERLGLIYMRDDEDEEKVARCTWLDDAFLFGGGGSGGKETMDMGRRGRG